MYTAQKEKDSYHQFVNDMIRLSLYGDFQYPLAADSTLEQFYQEAPEGEYLVSRNMR